MFGCSMDKAAVFAGFKDMCDGDDGDAAVVVMMVVDFATDDPFDFGFELDFVLMRLAPKVEDEFWARCAAACPARIEAADVLLLRG